MNVQLVESLVNVIKSKNQVALTQFLIPLEIVSFDVNATVIYGQIRANLERLGRIIGAMDMFIRELLGFEVFVFTQETIKDNYRLNPFKF